MAYEVLPLPFKPHRLEGLSDRLLVSHYENNYGGAVRRLNAIEGQLSGLDFAAAPVFDLNGLGRERLIAANSMLLHEAYFDALGGSGGNPSKVWRAPWSGTSAPSTVGVASSPPWARR
jgi:Fe-Mn family superoxide dismutase